MNFKNIFAVLLCLTAASAETAYKGECKNLQKKVEKNNTEEVTFNLIDCALDSNGKAFDYELEIDCDSNDFNLTQSLINDISTLTNLKKLSFSSCYSRGKNDLDFEPLKKLEHVTELFSYSSTQPNLTGYFKNLKKVTYRRYGPETISNSSIEDLTLADCDYDGDKVNLEALTNLKQLSISTEPSDAGDLDIRMPKNIKYLSLELFNPTKNLIKQIAANKNIEILNFEFNSFDTEKDDLSPLKKLTKLTDIQLAPFMSGDEIIVPDFIFSLTNLKRLFLGKVKNSEILEKIGNLKNLESLTLIESGVTSIDKISTLKNLKYLDLFGNEIDTLSDKIGNLKNLEYLDLSYTKFKTLPESLSKLKKLEHLELYSSEITEIPEFLNQLPNLKYVDFGNCENLKGKTLTNASLEECYYTSIKEGNICKTKDMACLSENVDIKPCADNSTKISTNGKCGPEDGQCPTGKCCSKYGYCGTSEKHCGTGCQSEFGQCTSTSNAVKISTNGKCGPEDGQCPTGKCCSKYGYCGTSEKHCGTGCQSEFGQCTKVKISTNGKCGPEDGQCPSGECCSKYGYCGTSEKHCKAGCQSQYGKCL